MVRMCMDRVRCRRWIGSTCPSLIRSRWATPPCAWPRKGLLAWRVWGWTSWRRACARLSIQRATKGCRCVRESEREKQTEKASYNSLDGWFLVRFRKHTLTITHTTTYTQPPARFTLRALITQRNANESIRFIVCRRLKLAAVSRRRPSVRATRPGSGRPRGRQTPCTWSTSIPLSSPRPCRR